MTALVTGGGGFLGGAIVRLLLARGARVRSLARQHYPDLNSLGVEQIQGDLGDPESVGKAVEGCDIVYHVAAKAGVWGRLSDYYRTNVVGTRNIIEACKAHGVPRLVYTSSPSVVFSGHDHEGITESAPYATRFLAHYPRTKAEAEQLVLGSNCPRLATVALRPHLIWGPGDNHLIPRIVARARAGKLRRIGDGSNRVDTIYIDNAAEAHLQAGERLAPGSAIAGKAYFLAQGEPVVLWDFVNQILAAAGAPRVTKAIPAGWAYRIGAILEAIYAGLSLGGEPPMTRFVARQLSTAHWFDLSAARRDLGYSPKVTVEAGLERLRIWFESQPG